MRAPPDGYTLFSAGPASAINATLYDKLSFNFLRDTAPVAGVMRVSNVLVVHPSFPAKTVPEFIAYAKANPGKLSMASGGIGSGSHMAGELFKMMAGVDMIHVPYRGAGPRPERSARRTGAGHVRPAAQFNRAHQGRQAPRSGGHHRDALARIAGHPDRGRFRPGLRGERGVRHRRTRGTRRPISSTGSTRKSMQASPIPTSRRGLPSSAARCLPARLPTSASSLPTKRRSGAR